jgi:hypothetical protein
MLLIKLNIFEEASFGDVREDLLRTFDHFLWGDTSTYILDHRRLNRILLEQEFPCELSNVDNRIISKGAPRSTRNLNSIHPNQLELPYYINENLHVFDFIIISLANKLERNMPRYHGPILTAEEPGNLTIKTSYEGCKNKYLDCINEFLSSKYTFNLIEKFGLELIFGMVRIRLEGFVGSYYIKNASTAKLGSV